MLTQRIGAANTAAALYAGEIINADTALRLGIAQELVDDPQAHAADLAANYARRSPTLMAAIKKSVQIASDSDLATSLDFESWAQAESLASEEFARFAAAFTK